MPLPSCDDFKVPLLKILNQKRDGLPAFKLYEGVAALVGLSEKDRQEAISDGTPKYIVRIKQARYRLKTRGCVANTGDGRWTITEAGIAYLSNPKPSVRTGGHKTVDSPIVSGEPVAAPPEVIDEAIKVINEQVQDEVLELLRKRPPDVLEHTVLNLLKAMGYTGKHGSTRHTGKSGDRGIDGIVLFDRLGLERICIQAKRYSQSHTVESEEIRTFCGALRNEANAKAVFVTTSKFSRGAREEALAPGNISIRLIN